VKLLRWKRRSRPGDAKSIEAPCVFNDRSIATVAYIGKNPAHGGVHLRSVDGTALLKLTQYLRSGFGIRAEGLQQLHTNPL
jgi:hypothetical protein